MLHQSFRECEKCHKMLIPAASQNWIKLCRECYLNSTRDTRYRACVSCGAMKIKKDSPVYFTKCSGCYGTALCGCGVALTKGNVKACVSCTSLASRHMLRCEECGLLKINSLSSSSLTVCEECLDTVPKRQCTKCAQTNIPVTAESWIKVCKACWIASKRP